MKKLIIAVAVLLSVQVAHSAQYGYNPHGASSGAQLNQQLQHISRFNTANANAPHLKAQPTPTVGNPNVTLPGVKGHVKTQHPPFAGEAWGNHNEHGESTGGGSRGNGSENAQNSRSAGGFGVSHDHIGGGRTGGGFHY